jgi:hypothetical protein
MCEFRGSNGSVGEGQVSGAVLTGLCVCVCVCVCMYVCIDAGKGKVVPLQAWTGLEGG